MTSEWSPLIFGRTWQVDFRFIAAPADARLDLAWVYRHINPMLTMPELLVEQPRWAVFQNETHCVFGVLCMVRALVDSRPIDAPPLKHDLTYDRKERDLYAWVGYVAGLTPTRPQLPPEPPGLALFAPALSYIEQSWEAENTDIETESGNRVLATTPVKLDIGPATGQHSLMLNHYREQIWLWPERDGRMLWQAAVADQQPVSVCLGLVDQRDALASQFRNGTSSTVASGVVKLKRSLSHTSTTERNVQQEEKFWFALDEAYTVGFLRSEDETWLRRQQTALNINSDLARALDDNFRNKHTSELYERKKFYNAYKMHKEVTQWGPVAKIFSDVGFAHSRNRDTRLSEKMILKIQVYLDYEMSGQQPPQRRAPASLHRAAGRDTIVKSSDSVAEQPVEVQKSASVAEQPVEAQKPSQEMPAHSSPEQPSDAASRTSRRKANRRNRPKKRWFFKSRKLTADTVPPIESQPDADPKAEQQSGSPSGEDKKPPNDGSKKRPWE